MRQTFSKCLFTVQIILQSKKAFHYSRPQPGFHLLNSPWAGIMYNDVIIPEPGEFGKWHPGWGREYRKAFLQCITVALCCRRDRQPPERAKRGRTRGQPEAQDWVPLRWVWVTLSVMCPLRSRWILHCKKLFKIFSSPSRDVISQTLPGRK